MTDAGEVVALVGDAVGNGPINVVLDCDPGAVLPAGARFVAADPVLTVGGVGIDLSGATRWDARPAWERLRARRGMIVAAARAARRANAGLCERRLLKQAGPAVEAAAAAFRQAWQQAQRPDSPSAARHLPSAIDALCGLGPGLTPAGDDWLAGWLLGQRLAPDLTGLADLSGLVVRIAPGRTTTLSRVFLESAAAGEADEAWHELLDALADATTNRQISKSADQRINEATARIMRHGATSGAAMLAGFFSAIETLAFTDDCQPPTEN